MEIFISWSGNRSKAVAEVLCDWLKCVLQMSKPWVSTRDIDPGSLWFAEINDRLKDVSLGIICITQDNKDKPWLLFEAGALAKGLSNSRVCPILIDLESRDITDPLAQFNHTQPNKEQMLKLVKMINTFAMGDHALSEKILESVFETYWPQFESGFESAIEENPSEVEPVKRSDNDVLGEILSSVRSISQRVNSLENKDHSTIYKEYNLANTPKNSNSNSNIDSRSDYKDNLLKELKSLNIALSGAKSAREKNQIQKLITLISDELDSLKRFE